MSTNIWHEATRRENICGIHSRRKILGPLREGMLRRMIKGKRGLKRKHSIDISINLARIRLMCVVGLWEDGIQHTLKIRLGNV